MAYIKISFITDSMHAECLSEALQQVNALSVSLEDAADQPLFQEMPEDNPLWKAVLLSALFPESISASDVIADIKRVGDIEFPLDYKIERMADEDWVRLTQQYFKPQQVGSHFWVCPSWYNPDDFDGEVLRVDPGLAFGTGAHPTTALCLRYLVEHPPAGKRVIDYGCGSGILALAAGILGAKKVYAVDHDPQAITATTANLALNEESLSAGLITIGLTDVLPSSWGADLIVANILLNPLITLQETFFDALSPAGTLVVSGVLEPELDTLVAAYQKRFECITAEADSGWLRVCFKRCNLS